MAQQTVDVIFKTHYFLCNPKEQIGVVGSSNLLGKWQTEKCNIAHESKKYKGHWSVYVTLPVDTYFEWKWVVVTAGKKRAVRWEEMENRRTFLSLPKKTERVEVVAPWNVEADLFTADGTPIKASSVHDITRTRVSSPEFKKTPIQPADAKERTTTKTTETDYTFQDGDKDWKTTKTGTTSGRKEVSTSVMTTNASSDAKTVSSTHDVKPFDNSKVTSTHDTRKTSGRNDVTSQKDKDVFSSKPVDVSDVKISVNLSDETKLPIETVGKDDKVKLRESSKTYTTIQSTPNEEKHKQEQKESKTKNTDVDKGKEIPDENMRGTGDMKTSRTKDSSCFEETITPVKGKEVETSVTFSGRSNITDIKRGQGTQPVSTVEEIVIPTHGSKVESSVSHYRGNDDNIARQTQDRQSKMETKLSPVSKRGDEFDLDGYLIRTVKVTAETKQDTTPKQQAKHDTISTSIDVPSQSSKPTVPDLSIFQKISSPKQSVSQKGKENDIISAETSATCKSSIETVTCKSSKNTVSDLEISGKTPTKEQKETDIISVEKNVSCKSPKNTVPDLSVFKKISAISATELQNNNDIISKETSVQCKSPKQTVPDLSIFKKISTTPTAGEQRKSEIISVQKSVPSKSSKQTVPDLSIFKKISTGTPTKKEQNNSDVILTKTTVQSKSPKQTVPDLSIFKKISITPTEKEQNKTEIISVEKAVPSKSSKTTVSDLSTFTKIYTGTPTEKEQNNNDVISADITSPGKSSTQTASDISVSETIKTKQEKPKEGKHSEVISTKTQSDSGKVPGLSVYKKTTTKTITTHSDGKKSVKTTDVKTTISSKGKSKTSATKETDTSNTSDKSSKLPAKKQIEVLEDVVTSKVTSVVASTPKSKEKRSARIIAEGSIDKMEHHIIFYRDNFRFQPEFD